MILKSASQTEGLTELLRSVPLGASLSDYAQAARRLSEFTARLTPVRVAELATYTLQPLEPFLLVEAARAGFAPNVYHGPFNALHQELRDPKSGCARHECDVVFVASLLEDVCPPLVHDFLSLSTEEAEKLLDQVVAELKTSITAFRNRHTASVVVHNFPSPAAPLLGIAEAMQRKSQSAAVRRLNEKMAAELATAPGIYVLDQDRLAATVGYERASAARGWYAGRAPWSPELLGRLAELQATFLRALVGGVRKCLVVDLDHTLWGGILGEDGPTGIQLGHEWPGNAYRDVQRALLQLHQRGVLLAINSKNNPEEVAEVFRSHPDMILRPEHFAAQRINWRSKPENMLELADELNLGLDSFVFLDDSPAERALMQQSLPQILVFSASDDRGSPDPLASLAALRNAGVFDRASISADDRRRGEMYREQTARRELAASAGSLGEFLSSLQMQAEVLPATAETLPRVVDLLHKTNQFNLTTRRHSAAAVAEFAARPEYGVFSLRTTDRFGDNGIVGVAIVRLQDDLAELDSLLLSCRVIGRTLETALLSDLAAWARRRGAQWMRGVFLPTPKNAPAAEFFAQHGFSRVGNEPGGGSQWLLDLAQPSFGWPEYIARGSEPAAASSVLQQSADGTPAEPRGDEPTAAACESQVRKVVASVLGVSADALSDDSSPQTLPQWDSLAHLNLLLALESELHWEITPQQGFALANFGTIRRFAAGERGALAAGSASEVQFRDLAECDIESFREFIFASYGPGYVLGADRDYLEWQYLRRESSSAGNGEAMYNLRLAAVDGRLAGCLGYIPCEVQIGGEAYRGCWLANWMVLPEYRHLGLGPALVREVSRDFQTTLALGANPEARDVLSRMGWTDYGTLARYVAVLNRERSQVLGEHGALDWPEEALRAAEWAKPHPDVCRVMQISDEVTAVWDRSRGERLSGAATRRTKAFLRWRYCDHRQFEYRCFEYRPAGQLKGMGIYRLEQARDLPVRIARIVELFAEGEAETPLLHTMLADAQSEGAAAADFFAGGRDLAETLAQAGFVSDDSEAARAVPTRYQPLDRKKSVIRFLADLSQIPGDPSRWNWYVSKADGDQDRPN